MKKLPQTLIGIVKKSHQGNTNKGTVWTLTEDKYVSNTGKQITLEQAVSDIHNQYLIELNEHKIYTSNFTQ